MYNFQVGGMTLSATTDVDGQQMGIIPANTQLQTSLQVLIINSPQLRLYVPLFCIVNRASLFTYPLVWITFSV